MTFSILSRPLTAGIGRCALGLTPAMRRFLVMALGQFMLVISGSAHAALPAPLSDFDVAQYIRLFDLQQQGNMKQATREMGRLENPLLKGHLLSQRYLHPTAWRSSYAELSDWLKLYNDHPDASRIFWLAKRRKPKNTKDPKSPKPGYLNGYGHAGLYGYLPQIPAHRVGRASPSRTANVARQVRRAIRRGWPSGALDVLKNPDNKRYLTKAEEGQLRAEKGQCLLALEDLLSHAAGLELVVLSDRNAHFPPHHAGAWHNALPQLAARFAGHIWLALTPYYDGQDALRFAAIARRAEGLSLPRVASGAPMMHHARRRRLVDVLSAIRKGIRLVDLGRHAQVNAEQRLRSLSQMRRLFHDYPRALAATRLIARRCQFQLDQLRYEYPSEISDGETPQSRLERLAWKGLAWRYPRGIPERAQTLMTHELALIDKLGYAPYFLTVHDIVAFARGRGILCQGRGSAANSITCYALGVTSVSPEIGTMVFERFVSEARDEPPDIDVDFEHERREEVIQWIYTRYGRHRAGICATVIHYRGKRAIREVGRAMGLSEDILSALSSQIWGSWGSGELQDARLREIGLDPDNPHLRLVMDLVGQIIGFPRHLSQHVGGFVITEGRLDALVPIENATMEDRTIIAWDKDDIDALGILKVDVLALGMLSCLRKSFDLLRGHYGRDFDLATLPAEDGRVYDMLCKADSLGVFQVESRAQMNFLPRMRPRSFYDLVIQVAIIRPGPIQGDMVHPFIRRRNGEEAVEFPSDALGAVLRKTLGVPLFQEQAMQIAIVGASFTPTEADALRRALATFKKKGHVSEFRARFLRGMQNNGYDPDFAARCFAQIEGFGAYGFPESHAASFALLVYASAWIKCHYPAVFACALAGPPAPRRLLAAWLGLRGFRRAQGQGSGDRGLGRQL